MISKKCKPGPSSTVENVEQVFIEFSKERKLSNDSATSNNEEDIVLSVQNEQIKSEYNFEEVVPIEADLEEEYSRDFLDQEDVSANEMDEDDDVEIEPIEYDDSLDFKNSEVDPPPSVANFMPVTEIIKTPLKRMRTTNPQEAKHKCDVCGKGFKKPYLLRTHKSYHSNNR